jgi:GNAT superfamily N-acetyltransferase
VDCRVMTGDEAGLVLALVLSVFDPYVRPDLTAEGIATVRRSARSSVLERQAGHETTVAEEDGIVVGMIDVKECSHIALFLVDAGRSRLGIGRGLLEDAIVRFRRRRPDLEAISVNSSLWAVPVYGRLGLVSADSQREIDGVRLTPMIRHLRGRSEEGGPQR